MRMYNYGNGELQKQLVFGKNRKAYAACARKTEKIMSNSPISNLAAVESLHF